MPVPWPGIEWVIIGLRQLDTVPCRGRVSSHGTCAGTVRPSPQGTCLFPWREAVRDTVRAWLTHCDHASLYPKVRRRLHRTLV
jgi:hypothetical protein